MGTCVTRKLVAVEQNPTMAQPVSDVTAPEAEGSDARAWDGRRLRWVPPVLVVLFVLLGNLVYLSGYSDPDPLGPRANLVTSAEPGRLPGDRTIDPNNGYITQALGREAARQVANGELPFWNAYEGAGSPLVASPQSAALFPPTLLNLLPNGLFLETLLLELVAGLATYFLLRHLGLSVVPALAAGVAFGLNGTFSWLQNGAMLPVAFLPLVLLGVERAVTATRDRRRGHWILIAVAIALAAYSGFVETVYLYGLLVAGWTGWRVVDLPRELRVTFARKVGAGVGAGALLSAPLLLPFLSYLGVADIGGHGGSLSEATLPHAAIPITLGLPYAFGPIFAFDDPHGTITLVWSNIGGFVTTTILVLAILGLWGRRLRTLRLVLLGWIAVCLLKTFGPALAVTLVNLVPGMDSVAFYRYMTPSFAFAVVVLAALALDDLTRGAVPRRVVTVSALIAAGVLGLGWLLARGPASDAPGVNRWLAASLVWAVVALVVIVALAWWQRPGIVAVIAALVVVDVMLCFAVPSLSAPRDVTVDRTTAHWLEDHLGNHRFFTFGPIAANYGSYFEIGSAAATNVPIPQRWADWLHRELGRAVDPGYFSFRPEGLRAIETHPDFLRALSVEYVVLARGTQVIDPLRSQLRRVAGDSVATIYALEDTAPYFDPVGVGCTTVPQGRQRVRVDCPGATRLVRRELAFPGWSVRIDGEPARLVSHESVFQAVALPPGTHELTFSYRPPYWSWAVLLWVLGVAWIGVDTVLSVRTARRRQAVAPENPG